MTAVKLLDVMGSDLTVVNAARVSLGKYHETFIEPDDRKLIAYLARNGHWTPFGQPQAQFRIQAPVFVARQWFRSNIGTVRNEVSRRYVYDEPTFFEFDHFRMRPDKSIKQGSGVDASPVLDAIAKVAFMEVESAALEAYNKMIQRGIAPEQARAILPQTMLTEWIETGSLAYWARFCGLRLDPHAQKEIRDYAVKISAVMAQEFPVSWEHLVHG